jgi:hypothetical protein
MVEPLGWWESMACRVPANPPASLGEEANASDGLAHPGARALECLAASRGNRQQELIILAAGQRALGSE